METRLARYNKENKIIRAVEKFSTKRLIIITVHVLFASLIVLADDLSYAAKISLFAFLSAMTLWVGTKIPAGYVAVSLILIIIFLKAGEPELLYHSFGEEVIWLMLGAFIIGEAIKDSGLADRISETLLNRTKNKHVMIRSLTYVLCISAFFIPSTSGRAALSLPIVRRLNSYFSEKEREVLQVSAPVIILMSTSATIIAAGSHLIGVGFLETSTGKSISFVQWLIWGVPFALTISLLSLFVIKMMLWPKKAPNIISHQSEKRTSMSQLYQQKRKQPMNNTEKRTAGLVILLIISWMTEPVHGYDIAFLTMFGAVLFMMPVYGVISWKQGIGAVSWNLILFVASATALGRVLVDTGVVAWMETEMIGVLQLFAGAPEWILVLLVLIVTVTSHLYITSHTTRAIVFIPALILFGQTIGADPVAIVFISLIGMNYCITFPVSSKALLLFYEEEDFTYDAKTLLKISLVLMPLYIFVMMVYYFTYWQWTGLSF
ncbi:SLC13 family permease [Virgibacillus siamensis]|uniref:SLC13 family permease n=1 Tax=Virgibacillus siamensis TaxID=480071 RepID=UPI0009867260|nr:SLC13 family permease [Virgibacillus siamensis]